MTTKILFKFAEKGINLSPEAYEKINSLEDPLDFSSSLIVKLKSQEFSEKDLMSLNDSIVEEFIKILGLDQSKKTESKSQKGLFTYDKENNKNNQFETNEKDINSNINADYEEKIRVEPNTINSHTKTKISSEIKESRKTANKYKKPDSCKNITLKNEYKKHNNSENITLKPDNSENIALKPDNSENIALKPDNSKNIALKPDNSENIALKPDNSKNIALKPDNSKNIALKPDNSENITLKPDNSENITLKNEYKKSDPDKFKRNLTSHDVDFDFKIIQDTSKKSYTSGEIGNLIAYFKSRYSKISNILSKRPELKAYQKINDIEEGARDLNVIVMVRDIRATKNGHKIVEFEDETGEINVLFHKDNQELFKASEKLVKDEIIGLIAEKKGTLNVATRIINPGVPRIPRKEMDFAAVFTSDIHIGSLTFLEDAFVRFTEWINGDFGSEEQRNIAKDVKYLIVAGDIVDGIGIYPNQDKELAIKDITEQYDEAARLLGNIRGDVKIIITPGNHDASRVAEPQPAVPEKYAKSLYELNNVEFVSNPAVVSLDGWNTLIYHGRGFDDLAMTIKGFSHEKNDLIMEELLNKRHLAPIYGERTPLASELEDHLVIDNIPDIFHTGHVHINTYKHYNGVHMINSGTFQTQTEFQKIYNIVPTCAEVPVLHKGVYKQLKFI
ncbi:DNA polymerase II small subunit [Methanobrevibacter cuticularis]|uniref:DNA polymerase II small subunit n=1 Tax=Methanobrevibacter cuticularis TaxID=47311 RepID=A0A166CKV9_9EURY|nr:DNA-directed DNA polymerase II small subunit [Methanobrevibacter cuticularis]KZX14616.1 DNA polymerase II small subunit [Methanobrevibacter cuticularis]